MTLSPFSLAYDKTKAEKPRLLFIDDEELALLGLKRILRDYEAEWVAEYVEDGVEALELHRKNPFDVVVTDLNMPSIHGLELLKKIKDDFDLQATEVIVLTGLNQESLKREALELGASDLLQKPVQREDLIARLKNAIRAKSYYDELQFRNRQLKEKLLENQRMEVVGTLAAGVIHDLKNLIGGIVEYSDFMVKHDDPPPHVKEGLSHICSAGNHCVKMVKQIHRFSQPHSDEDISECNFSDLIVDCLSLLKASIDEQIEISWELPKAPVVLQADATLLYQIIINLVINGADAIGKNPGELKVSLQFETIPEKPDEGYARLIISDTGCGIPDELKDQIFSPKFTTKGNSGGSGLGLSVVKEIIRSLHGSITVESQQGKGTRFNICLPNAYQLTPQD